VVAHYKNFSASLSRCPFVKLKSFFVKPAGPWLLVICEREPKPRELADLLGVLISQEVNDVRDAQVS
jgi:hypothetical protein